MVNITTTINCGQGRGSLEKKAEELATSVWSLMLSQKVIGVLSKV